MSDWCPDSPMLGRRWCPSCEPDADPAREILDTHYCVEHELRPIGSADPAPSGVWLNGTMEAEAAGGCRAVADLIRRGGA